MKISEGRSLLDVLEVKPERSDRDRFDVSRGGTEYIRRYEEAKDVTGRQEAWRKV